MVWSRVKSGCCSLLFLLLAGCSESMEGGLFVVLTDPPNFQGKTGSVFYLCSLKELKLDEAPFHKIFNHFDQRAEVATPQELTDLFKVRSSQLSALITRSLSTEFLLDYGIPVRVVRLPCSGLDAKVFPEEELFREANFISEENREKGKKLLSSE